MKINRNGLHKIIFVYILIVLFLYLLKPNFLYDSTEEKFKSVSYSKDRSIPIIALASLSLAIILAFLYYLFSTPEDESIEIKPITESNQIYIDKSSNTIYKYNKDTNTVNVLTQLS